MSKLYQDFVHVQFLSKICPITVLSKFSQICPIFVHKFEMSNFCPTFVQTMILLFGVTTLLMSTMTMTMTALDDGHALGVTQYSYLGRWQRTRGPGRRTKFVFRNTINRVSQKSASGLLIRFTLLDVLRTWRCM